MCLSKGNLMRLSRKWIIIGGVILVASFAFVMQSLAATAPNMLDVPKPTGCTIRFNSDYDLGGDPPGLPDFAVSIYEVKAGGDEWLADLVYLDLVGPYDGSVKGSYFGDPGKKYALESWCASCGVFDRVTVTVPEDCRSEPTNWWFSVEQVNDPFLASNAPSPDGTLACGLFDVQGWGAKTVDLSAYPDCTGDVVVYCLDGEGNWTGDTIHNLKQNGTVVTFTSGQHGTCGFFPAP